jgi:hypothetical protein
MNLYVAIYLSIALLFAGWFHNMDQKYCSKYTLACNSFTLTIFEGTLWPITVPVGLYAVRYWN